MSNRLASAHTSDRVPAPTFVYRSEADLMVEARELRAKSLRETFAKWRAERAAARTAKPANSNSELSTAEYGFVVRRANEMRAERMSELLVAAGRWVAGLFRKLRQSAAEARAMRELAGLDDRMLADIGISRNDIPSLVRREHDQRMPSTAQLKPRTERLAA